MFLEISLGSTFASVFGVEPSRSGSTFAPSVGEERSGEQEFGRGEWIRTTDLLVPNQAL